MMMMIMIAYKQTINSLIQIETGHLNFFFTQQQMSQRPQICLSEEASNVQGDIYIEAKMHRGICIPHAKTSALEG